MNRTKWNYQKIDSVDESVTKIPSDVPFKLSIIRGRTIPSPPP